MKKLMIVALSLYSMVNYGMGGVVPPLQVASLVGSVDSLRNSGSPSTSPRAGNTVQTCQIIALKTAVRHVETSLQSLFNDERMKEPTKAVLMAFLNDNRSPRRKGSKRLHSSTQGPSSPSTPRNLIDYSAIFPHGADAPKPCSTEYAHMLTRNIFLALSVAAKKYPTLGALAPAIDAEIEKLSQPTHNAAH